MGGVHFLSVDRDFSGGLVEKDSVREVRYDGGKIAGPEIASVIAENESVASPHFLREVSDRQVLPNRSSAGAFSMEVVGVFDPRVRVRRPDFFHGGIERRPSDVRFHYENVAAAVLSAVKGKQSEPGIRIVRLRNEFLVQEPRERFARYRHGERMPYLVARFDQSVRPIFPISFVPEFRDEVADLYRPGGCGFRIAFVHSAPCGYCGKGAVEIRGDAHFFAEEIRKDVQIRYVRILVRLHRFRIRIQSGENDSEIKGKGVGNRSVILFDPSERNVSERPPVFRGVFGRYEKDSSFADSGRAIRSRGIVVPEEFGESEGRIENVFFRRFDSDVFEKRFRQGD